MNKRKVLSIFLLALITVALAVSCSSNIETPAANSEELAYVTFGNGHSRELSTSYETLPYNSLYWFYTAQKTDSYGTTGQVGLGSDGKPTEAVSKNGEDPAQGLSGRVGPFSQGAWDFTLYAYKEAAKTTLVYKSEAVHVILKGGEVKNVPVSVSTQGDYGYVKFKNAYFRWLESTDTPAGQGGGEAAPQMEITLTKTGTTIKNDIVLNYVQVEGANRFNVQDELSVKTSATENPDRIPEGFYTAKVIVYLKQEASGNNVAIDNKGTPIFSQEFGLRVYGNATTYISGDMVEGVDSYVTFDVADQAMRVFTVNTNEATTVTANVTALNGNKESAESVAENQKTTVTFPAGALASAEHQLNVAVTPIASAEQKFQASGKLNGQTAVSGIDLTMVKVEEQNGSLTQTPVTTFNDKSVTVTTYIATGLSNVTVRYLNNGELSDTGISDITYNPGSGLLTFKTTHFSQYVVVAPVEAINVNTGVPYTSLATAIADAKDGQEVKLLKDVCLTKSIVIEKDVALDLNGCDITVSATDFSEIISYTSQAPFYVKSGAKLTINDSSTGEERGKIDATANQSVLAAVILTIKDNHDENKTAELVVNNGELIGTYYGITTNGNRHNTSIVINGGRIFGSSDVSSLAIYNPNNGSVIINGGRLNGYDSAIEIRAGQLLINDGEFTSRNAVEFKCEANGSGSTTSGAAIAIAQHTTKMNISVEINGGTFNGIRALNESNPQNNIPAPQVSLSVTGGTFNGVVSADDVSGFITGGTFSSDPSAYVAEGYVAVKGEDDKYTVQIAPVSIRNSDDSISYFADLKSALSYVKSNELNNITISLGSGTFSLPTGSCVNKTITITGSGNDTVLHILDNNKSAYQNGATLQFNNMTVLGQTSDNYGGLAHTNSVSYNSCKILGKLTLYGSTETFTDCVFENYNDYSIWTWGGKEVTFTDCTFNTGGKALLLYGGAGSKDSPTTKLNVTGCTFNSNGTLASDKAAIEIGNDYNATYFLNVSNVTVNGFAVNPAGISTGSTIWGNKNSMDSDHLVVTIDGIKVY